MTLQVMGFGGRTLPLKNSNAISLPAGSGYLLPSGQYAITLGPYSFLQWFDPITFIWRNIQSPLQSDPAIISSDGTNYRLMNALGTVVGAVVTNGGSGYTNGIYYPAGFPIGTNPNATQQLGTAAAPSVLMSAGGGSALSVANLVVGGAINTTVTVTAGGSNYTKVPILLFSPPPSGGVQATGTATLTSGAISGVTVVNAGAGYTTAPTITVVNAQGDTTGAGAVLTVNATLTNSGQIVAITYPYGGAGHTSVPTFTFAPASTTAATAIMCWTATTVTWAGASNAGNGNFGLIGSTVTAGSNTTTNPAITTGLFTPRMGFTAFSTTATPTTTTIIDGGLHQIVPNAVLAMNSNGTISAATTTTIAQGGVTDTSWIQQI